MIKIILEDPLDTDQTTKKIMLPVPPKALPIKLSAGNKTYNLLNYGEVTRFKIPKQFTLTIQSFFPSNTIYFPYRALKTFQCKTPEFYHKCISMYMHRKRPLKLYIIGSAVGDLTFNVSVESFDISQISGNSGNVDYTLTLKEYREVKTEYLKTISIPKANLPDPPYSPINAKPTTEKTKPTTKEILAKQVDKNTGEFIASPMERLYDAGNHTDMNYSVVTDGESLTDIVKQSYGTTEFVQEVRKYKTNSKIKNPSKLKEGTTVVLPALNKLR